MQKGISVRWRDYYKYWVNTTRLKITYMGMWTLLAGLVVVVFLLFGAGHRVYHTRKAKRNGSMKQTSTH